MSADDPVRQTELDPKVEQLGERRDLRNRCAELCREHNAELVRRAYTKLHSWQRANDAVQEAYVRVFRLNDPPPISFLRAYLHKTVDNVAIDWLREEAIRRRDEHLVQSVTEKPNPTPEDEYLDEELRRCLQAAVNELPPKCRLAYTLVELQDRTVKEAAAEIGSSEMAVYQLVNRAYGYLARALSVQGWRK